MLGELSHAEKSIDRADVLLLNPNYWSEVFGANVQLPCGLGFIAEVLKRNGTRYGVIDLNFQSSDDVFEFIERHRPRYLGISQMSYRVEASYELLERVKASYPEITVIMGGPHVIAEGTRILHDCTALDIGCIGEGEETILEIVNGADLSTISGIHYRCVHSTDAGTPDVFTTTSRPTTKDLNGIPFPTYDGFQLHRYQDAMVLASSRGCPYQCTFCGAPTFLGKKWRKRDSDGMLEELLYWYGRGYRAFFFEDSLFTADKKRIIRFCSRLRELNLPITIDVHGARADHMNADVLKAMKSANFRTLTFGVESANDHVLKAYKKAETFEQIERGITLADSLGFNIGMFFIIGGPGESVADVRRSFEFSQRFANVHFVYFFLLTPVPGTPFFEQAVELGYVDENMRYPTGQFGFEGYTHTGNDVMSPEEITQLLKEARKLEIVIRRRFSIRQSLRDVPGSKYLPTWISERAVALLLKDRLFGIVRSTKQFVERGMRLLRPAHPIMPVHPSITIGPEIR